MMAETGNNVMKNSSNNGQLLSSSTHVPIDSSLFGELTTNSTTIKNMPDGGGGGGKQLQTGPARPALVPPRTAQSASSTIDLEVTQRINQARMERLNTNLEKLIE